MLKAYKFRLYPNKNQIVLINKYIGSCRFIYNWALDQKIKTYQETQESISQFDLNKKITILRKENKWLSEVNSQSLQGMTRNLESAFTKFFREKKGFPRFKSKRNPVQSFPIPQHYTVDFESNEVKLPKMGVIKTKLHRRFEGKLKTATVSRTPTDKYFISILVDDNQPLPDTQPSTADTTIGVDVGIKYFAILSDETKIPNPKHLKSNLIKMKIIQRRASRKQKGSNNRRKANLVVSKLHEKIHNQRNDFQHKISSSLIDENQAIALETLNISGMLKNHCLAQAISDASWASFVTKLTYKADWYGKTILRIGRFEPSTKICSMCGYNNSNITLSDRTWCCPECHTNHDRDINAAINIKNFALISQNLITP